MHVFDFEADGGALVEAEDREVEPGAVVVFGVVSADPYFILILASTLRWSSIFFIHGCSCQSQNQNQLQQRQK